MSVGTWLRNYTRTTNQIRYSIGVVAILGICIIPISTIVLHEIGIATYPTGVYYDFAAYWLAADRWQHGVSLYASTDLGHVDQLPVSEVVPYMYPPAVVLPVYFYQFVPYVVAGTLWGVTTVGSLWLALVILLEEYYPMTWVRRMAIGPFLFFFQPVWYAFDLGQITPLLAAFVTLSAVAMERSHNGDDSMLIGVGVSAAAFVKPFLLPTGAVLLLSWRQLGGAVLTMLGLIGIGVVAVGWTAHIEYIDALLHAKPGTATNIFSVQYYHPGWFEPFDILGVWSWIPRIALLVAVGGLSLWRVDTVDADRAAFAAGAVVVPLAAPEAYTLSFVFYLPAVIVLSAVRPTWWPYLLLTIAICHWQAWTMYWLGTHGVTTTVAAFLQPGLYASLLLLGMALYLLWESRRSSLGVSHIAALNWGRGE